MDAESEAAGGRRGNSGRQKFTGAYSGYTEVRIAIQKLLAKSSEDLKEGGESGGSGCWQVENGRAG